MWGLNGLALQGVLNKILAFRMSAILCNNIIACYIFFRESSRQSLK